MNIYQQELFRKLRLLGCTGNYDEESRKLNVQYEGILLCKQDGNGFLTYDSRSFTPVMCDKLEEVKEQAAAIREYADTQKEEALHLVNFLHNENQKNSFG